MKRLGLILLVAIFITGCKNTEKTLENNTDKSGNNTGVSLTEKNSAQSISGERVQRFPKLKMKMLKVRILYFRSIHIRVPTKL